MASSHPVYKSNPPCIAQRWGRKTVDELTGEIGLYEYQMVVQNGLWKNARNRGSVYKDYGPGLWGYPPNQ